MTSAQLKTLARLKAGDRLALGIKRGKRDAYARWTTDLRILEIENRDVWVPMFQAGLLAVNDNGVHQFLEITPAGMAALEEHGKTEH